MSGALILMYHQVDVPRSEREQRFCTPPKEFVRQIDWLRAAGYQGVGIEDMVAYAGGGGRLPEKAVHITFDDGFIGVLEHAQPILIERGFPATLFALSGQAGTTNDWMSQRGFPRRALLSSAQLRLLADEGMTIGSHSRTHAHLSEIPSEEARREIVDSRTELEEMLGREVSHFAYPYGQHDEAVRDMAINAGYRSACSTRSGFNRSGEDPFSLRRIDVYGTDRLWQFRQKLRFGTNQATRIQSINYYGGRLATRLGFG